MKTSYTFKYRRLLLLILFLLAGGLLSPQEGQSQNREELQLREYTDPDELVRFDRTTSFERVLDVINDFAEEYENKMIIDRSGTTGEIGISIPPMYWKKALDLILNVNNLALLDVGEYYEIVDPSVESEEGFQTVAQSRTTGGRSARGAGGGGTATAGDLESGAIPLTLDTREIRINAIFFEGNRRALREIGVDWSTLTENVPDEVVDESGENPPQIPSSLYDGPFVQVNSTGASSVSQNVFNSLVNFGELGNTGIRVQALFSAFEADNLGEIISSPTIRVMDGQEGRIQVGQDFSIKQRDIAGNVVDQFFSVGTILTVTPRIISQGDSSFIHLSIAAERSSAQPDPVSTIINTEEAETQSLLLDGETTAIAGLYSTESSSIRRGIPILKDLPPWFFGLRYLFGYNTEDDSMSELVILLQAEIVPSLSERMAQKIEPKFDVLARERQIIRQDIRAKNESSDVELLGAADEEDDPLQEPLLEQEAVPTDSLQEPEPVMPPEPAEEEITAEADSVWADTAEARQDTAVALQRDVELQQDEIMLNFEEEEADSVAPADSVFSETGEEVVSNEPEAVETSDEIRFFIIGGSFGERSNAVAFRDQLGSEGYDAAIIPQPDRGLFLVAYRGYASRGDASSALADIQQYVNSDAWLFVSE